MAAVKNSHTVTEFLPLLLILINLSPSSSQSLSSPQNIQTFYPFSPPPTTQPPPPTPPPAPSPPPIPPINPPQRQSSTRAAVGRAIGVTAAATIVLSGLLFFLLLRRSRRKRSEENGMAARGGADPAVHPNDAFARFDGNIKGLIVDENGLDVLYWRNLEEGGENVAGFTKQYYGGERPEEVQEKRMVSGRERKSSSKPPKQEVPLLRGKSSTSQSPIWAEDEDQVMKKEASFSTKMSFKAMERQGSIIQLTKQATQLPPAAKPPAPPPPPRNPLHNSLTPPLPLPPQMTVEENAAATAPPPPPVPPQMAVEKRATPPPPPPQPPQMVVNKTTAPPPPPPPQMAVNKTTAPPPPPPKTHSPSTGEGTSSSHINEQVKLKPLHWDKVNPDSVEHSMVWDKIDKGSFKFDGDLMEALFGYVATNRKSPQRDGSSPSGPNKPEKSGPPQQIFILDTRKSQNTSIVLKSLGVTRKEIIDALLNGRGLNLETMEKLTKIAPSDQEAAQITAFNGDPTRLADAESFLYHLLKSVPSAFSRFKAMFFRSNHESEVNSVRDSLKSLELACNELRTRGLFVKLLEAVLKAGNRLNAGTSRGNAQAFNLTALRKLSDVKSSDGKTTLLEFVVQEVVRAEGKRCVLNKSRGSSRASSQGSEFSVSQSPERSKDDREREYMTLGLPVIGGLSAEFSNVKKAAALSYDVLTRSIAALSEQVVEVRELVSRCGNGGGFAREMKGFLDTAELEAKVAREEEDRVMELVKKTTEYYQAGGLNENGGNSKLLLFVIVRDFLEMVDRVCIEIARNVQRRKLPASYVAGGSSSPGSPRVFRFPKLPANFMSDNSKNGSDDDR